MSRLNSDQNGMDDLLSGIVFLSLGYEGEK